MSIFQDAPEFIEQDLRKNRAYLPINQLSLTTKCEALLPKELIEDKSILDLGSCLGAMGHWALSHGAKHYHGIETQDNFVAQSKQLLQRWGHKASIEKTNIRSALTELSEKSFDIIIAAGVLHLFLDPHIIIGLMCKVANDYLAIEATSPPSVRRGKISADLPILEFTTAACNSDADEGQFVGPTAMLSQAATEWVCQQYGFVREMVDLTPPLRQENISYSMSMDKEVIPFRYFARFHRQELAKAENLEDIIKTKNMNFYQTWQESPINQRAEQQKVNKDSAWKFDNQVANNFQDIAEKHIPNYSKTLDACIDIIAKAQPLNAKIIDVGCATGETLRRLKKRGFNNLWGVDNSKAMLEKANISEASCIHSDVFPEGEAPFDVIIANWTLHFIADRENYIKSIINSLAENGLFFLTEKTSMSELMKDYYYDYKRVNGVTESEIIAKEKSLQGILCTYPLAWYYNVLLKYGCKKIDILTAERGFVTLCCQR